MRYKSASTTITDAYRAGSEIGEELKGISPEVILLFASITVENCYADVIAGLYDGLESSNVIVFGGTGDGVYETTLTSHFGICALGISSGGTVRWSTACETGVGSDSAGTARRCASAALANLVGTPGWAFVMADGITADGAGIVAGLQDVFSFPCVGGLAGDDRKFSRSLIFVNESAIHDGVAVLLASGGLPFIANAASGFVPLGAPGIIEVSSGKTILRINGQTPFDFIKEQIGKPLSEADLGKLALTTTAGPLQNQSLLRVLLSFDRNSGSITSFAGLPEGSTVRVSVTDHENLLRSVSDCVVSALRTGFKPAAVLVISCVGRKWQLQSCGEEEVQALQNIIGHAIPLVGFPSFGEIGPFLNGHTGYTETCFHNATFVVCLLGA